jgi:RecB family endonuclease NucS
MPQLMAVLFRPVTAQLGQFYEIEKYSMESAKRYVETLKSMRMSQVQGALVFFSTIARDCVTDTLEEQLMEAMKTETRST